MRAQRADARRSKRCLKPAKSRYSCKEIALPNAGDFVAFEGTNLKKPALDTLFAAVPGVILAPLWDNFWADKMPAVSAPLVALIGSFILAGIAVFGFAVPHYFRALGARAEPVGTRERNGDDGNWIARGYARRLEVFLNAGDRFFGDAEMAD